MTASGAGLHRLPVQMLGDLVSPRALERLLQDAAQTRGLTLDTLGGAALEDILKREVFKRLQLSIPAPLAKRRVSEVLNELQRLAHEAAPPPGETLDAAAMAALEEGARKFSLYFDWPETQRLRSLLGVVRDEEQGGRPVAALIGEGQDLVAQLERRLAEGLAAQGQDLAELQAAALRVQGMGTREVRRLDTLIAQIADAQGQGTLLPGEVERARDITFKLRKLLESSVVQAVPGAGTPTLDPEAQARVLALEHEHAAGQLAALERDFAPLLSLRPALQARGAEVRARHAAGTLGAEDVEAWRAELGAELGAVLAEQRAAFAALDSELSQLSASEDLAAGVRVLLSATRQTLDLGRLATDGLRELAATRDALAGGGGAQLALHQELLDLERTARGLPAAQDELAADLAAARSALEGGASPDLTPLWTVLERHMGEAAREREALDARTDTLLREYGGVRTLAGETIQRLGRLADALRAQRRLGALSLQGRARYEHTLHEAEALLAEAQAEARAAQEVTATFGQDALSGLLGVFDVGDMGALGEVAAPTPEAPPSAPPATPLDDFLSGLAPAAPAELRAGPPAFPGVQTWSLKGRAAEGAEPLPPGFSALLESASRLGLARLDMADDTHVYSARRHRELWRLARADTWDALDGPAGRWLDGGPAEG